MWGVVGGFSHKGGPVTKRGTWGNGGPSRGGVVWWLCIKISEQNWWLCIKINEQNYKLFLWRWKAFLSQELSKLTILYLLLPPSLSLIHYLVWIIMYLVEMKLLMR